MHLAEGVLNGPTLISCAALAAGGVALGLRRLDDDRLPLAALLAAVFFVASTVHVPVGVGSVHLILNGLAGLLLGWAAFPVILVALLLQAALFSFGGFAVLGANTLLLALPAVAAHYALRGALRPQAPRAQLLVVGALAGVIGIGGAAAIAAGLLAASGGRALADLTLLFAAAHVPVLVIDGLVGGLALAMLARVLPRALRLPQAHGLATGAAR
ncbi:MAG: cobalt transporter CbiM [Burkholderiales bacterium]|nr:cobalt transporter CbiM [Burkholderiales bacterium]